MKKKKVMISNGNVEIAIEYDIEHPVHNGLNGFKNHPSIKMMISKIN